LQFEAAELFRTHPPLWRHGNKQAVFDAIRAANAAIEGPLAYARWAEERLPETLARRSEVDIRDGVFTYDAPARTADVEWHLNFADPALFVAYGSSLLAQDEMQVLEHPILGSLREALGGDSRPSGTADARGRPTPVTVTGAQRCCSLATRPDPSAGRPHGLYGNAFACAPVEDVLAATRIIVPPTRSNILAMSAPACGRGPYTVAQIELISTTAYTGFLAAREESRSLAGSTARTVVHTGFWGCGAFGGNRILMTMLQVLAADLAGVDLVLHGVDRAGVDLLHGACEELAPRRTPTTSVQDLMRDILQRGFQWGESDGN
jgi:hypothetical protein